MKKGKQVQNEIALAIERARREGAAEMRERASNLLACHPDPLLACQGLPNQICNACYRALKVRGLSLPGEEE
jgi:hypothetical protein